jgi:predicted RNase H-like HicB family nuclease
VNNLKKYKSTVLIEKEEDEGFIAVVPELKGCHTQGETLVEVMANIKEAIELCFEVHDQMTNYRKGDNIC